MQSDIVQTDAHLHSRQAPVVDLRQVGLRFQFILPTCSYFLLPPQFRSFSIRHYDFMVRKNIV